MPGFQQKSSKLKNVETLDRNHWKLQPRLPVLYLNLCQRHQLTLIQWRYHATLDAKWLQCLSGNLFTTEIGLTWNSLFCKVFPHSEDIEDRWLESISKVMWAADHQATQLSIVQEKLHHQTLVSEVRQMYLHLLRKGLIMALLPILVQQVLTARHLKIASKALHWKWFESLRVVGEAWYSTLCYAAYNQVILFHF